VEDLVEIFNRSQINLGHGGIGYSETLTNVKGRDFDVPCTGGGMYLTTFNSDLAQHFRIGEEIACYQSREELIDLIHHYLRRPDERREMARRARQRCVREHRWSYRYIRILQLLGVLNEEAVPPPLPEEAAVGPSA
jgi:spore maturation protein CgeB